MVAMLSRSLVSYSVTPVARQAPLCLGFPRYRHWGALPCPPPGEPPGAGMEPVSPALAGGLFTTEPPGKPSVVRQPQFPQTASAPSAAGPHPARGLLLRSGEAPGTLGVWRALAPASKRQLPEDVDHGLFLAGTILLEVD